MGEGQGRDGPVIFGPKSNHPTTYVEDPAFLSFKTCNDRALAEVMGVNRRERLSLKLLEYLTPDERQSSVGKIVSVLAGRLVPPKSHLCF